MIFGRRKKVDEATDEGQHGVDPQVKEEEVPGDEGDLVEDDDLEEDDDDLEDEGKPVDSSLRADGPFDIDEVDLDADEVDRLDFGTLIITPFEDMQMQLQADQTTNEVQSALIMAGQSALELALFAAPLTTSMVDEVVAEVVNATPQQGGETQIQDGPYGPDVRRTVPVQNEQGEPLMHVSRTWYAQGPRWLLRGTLMGQAALADDFASPDAELLLEVFRNTVVRRGTEPKVPGDLIPMSLPESMVPVEG